ncbi:MAG: hypothetical protein A2X09_15080 [Bacteroidetes bacterium GWF2_43_11]|nr:MAG: hypothetical protein A2X09_15080 [Bacteroidetes bacterium GWF2_43_11]
MEIFKNSEAVKSLNETSICIDCGAHIGRVSDIFAGIGATVYAFEPHPQVFAQLSKRFEFNPKVHCIPKGVYNKATTMNLYMFKYACDDELFWAQGSSIYATNKEIDNLNYIEIEMIDLISFIKELNVKIDILKLDVEGAEFDILENLIKNDLHNSIHHILVESHENEILELADKAAYIKKIIAEKNINNINLEWI